MNEVKQPFKQKAFVHTQEKVDIVSVDPKCVGVSLCVATREETGNIRDHSYELTDSLPSYKYFA